MPIDPHATAFLLATAIGCAVMLGLIAFPGLARNTFLIGLLGLGALLSLEGADGVHAIFARALTEIVAAVPPASLVGLSAGMLTAALLAGFIEIKRR